MQQFVDGYRTKGYGIARGVFSTEEIAALKGRFDVWYGRCLDRHGDFLGKAKGANVTFTKGNHRVWLGKAPEGAAPDGRYVRGLQWPSYEDGVLDGIRTDPRLYQLLSPLLGHNIKQLINQMHWKLPGSQTQWRYHQDARSRKPDSAFRELASSYVQVGIAVERFDEKTGGMQVIPFSHVQGKDHGIEAVAAAMGLGGHGGETSDTYHEMLRRAGLNPEELVQLELQPGDLVAWGPFVVHGGGLNTTTPEEKETRAFYINGYVKGENCDRGHWAWREGQAVPLGKPVLVQMDNYEQTEAEGGKYFEDDVTGLSDRDIERLRAVTTVRD